MGRNSAPRSPCEPVRVWEPIRVPCAPGKHLPGMEIKEELLMKKRFVALLLCLVMVVGLIPAAMAAGPEGDRNYITFKANDGSYGSSSERLQQLTESDVAIGWVTLRANDFNRDGYTFLGWFTDEDCTTEFDFTSAVTANVTLYAGWMEESADVVSVTFDYNYAGAPAAATTYVENGATVAERGVTDRENTIASDDGKYSYTFSETAFAGWYTDEACTVEYDFSTPVTENITLYAGWEPTTYTFEAELTPLVGKTGEGYSFSVADEQLIRVDTEARGQDASMGYSVGYLYKFGHQLNYKIYSDRDVSNVTLTARLSSEYRDIYIAPETETVDGVTYEAYQFNVNGESVDYLPIALEGAKGTAEPDQRPFDNWEISRTVSLTEGWNTIDLVTYNNNELASNITAMAPMIDCIYLSTDADLSWEPVWANLDNTEIIDG